MLRGLPVVTDTLEGLAGTSEGAAITMSEALVQVLVTPLRSACLTLMLYVFPTATFGMSARATPLPTVIALKLLSPDILQAISVDTTIGLVLFTHATLMFIFLSTASFTVTCDAEGLEGAVTAYVPMDISLPSDWSAM